MLVIAAKIAVTGKIEKDINCYELYPKICH